MDKLRGPSRPDGTTPALRPGRMPLSGVGSLGSRGRLLCGVRSAPRRAPEIQAVIRTRRLGAAVILQLVRGGQ